MVLLGSLAIALHAFLFQAGLSGDPAFQAHLDTRLLLAAMHVLGSGLALMAHRGVVARVGFITLEILWIASITFAYRVIRARHFVTHQQWMLRNLAPTFGPEMPSRRYNHFFDRE